MERRNELFEFMRDEERMDMDLRHRLIAGSLKLIAAAGADRWLVPLTRGAGAILMFHHVRPARADAFQPNALLEVTPNFLDASLGLVRQLGFEVIALDEVPERLVHPGGPPFVALTFDDGYRDNVEHAFPVLKRHGCPWTVFVTVDYASGEGRLWWIELERAIARLDTVRVEIEGVTQEVPTGTAAEKRIAFDRIYWELRRGCEHRLRRVIAELCQQAGLDPSELVGELCLGWDELRALAAEPGVTIGAHTLSHPMLAKHGEAEVRREIVASRDRIAQEIGRPIRHLAYPVGDPTSAGRREFQIAAEAGFATAVTTRPGHLFAGHRDHLMALPRVSVNGLHQSQAALRSLLSGVPFAAKNRGRKLNVG